MSVALTPHRLEVVARRAVPESPRRAALDVLEHLRDGRFQRSLSLIVAATSVASGLEVGYEHYKGSYSNPVMYSPVLLSAALAGAGAAAVFSRSAAKTLSARGERRVAGGWRHRARLSYSGDRAKARRLAPSGH